MENFNPNATSITLEFDCLCGATITAPIEQLPQANMLAENVEDSENIEEYTIACECGNEYTCNVYMNMYEGNVEVRDCDDNDVVITKLEYQEDIE